MVRMSTFLMLLILLLASCATTPSVEPPVAVEPAETPPVVEPAPAPTAPAYPHLVVNGATEGGEMVSPVSATLVGVETEAPGLVRAILSCEIRYYLPETEVTHSYELVVGGLREVTADTGPLQAGQRLGVASARPYVTARSAVLDPYLVRTSVNPPFRDTKWWFSPDWLIPSVTQWLSFRPVPTLEGAIEDFYQRWAVEQEPEGEATIHYFPNLDRIRAPFALKTYPTPVEPSAGLGLTEMAYYRKGLFTLQSWVDLNGEYDAMLYWQTGFDGYLREEYVLGTPLWLYCSVYTLDHAKKLIVVCVRDFALRPDEAIIEQRISSIDGGS